MCPPYQKGNIMTVKISDRVRYTGWSKFDLTTGKIYKVHSIYEWGFTVLDDAGDANNLVNQSYEPVEDEEYKPMTHKAAYEKFTADAKQSQLPPIWDDMTDAEKGALLLADYKGKVIEYYDRHSSIWLVDPSFDPRLDSQLRYRVAEPEPVVETVTLHGQKYVSIAYPSGMWDFDRSEKQYDDTHRITFNLIDGKPDLDSIKMKEL